MTKESRQVWLTEGAPGAERERLLALRGQTLALRAPRSARRPRVERTPLGRLSHITLSVAFWLLVAALVAVAVTAYRSKRAGGIPSVLGYSVLRVETGSMVPTLPIGCFVIVRAPSDPAALPEGTIVTFRRGDGMVVTHRIIEVLEEGGGTLYRTKGDNPQNVADEELLSPERVIGAYAFNVTLPSVWGGD